MLLRRNTNKIEDFVNCQVDKKLIMNCVLVNMLKKYNIKNYDLFDINSIYYKNIIKTKTFDKINEIINNEKSELILPNFYEFISLNDNKRKIYGLFYTPQWLIKYLVDNTVEIKNKDIEEIKILEPSCGCGSFLIYIFEYLYNKYLEKTDYSKSDIVKFIIEKNIYAYDIDSEAIKYAIYLLKIKVHKILGYIPKLKFNIFNEDFLLDEINTKYDYIIGNPPFLENRKINRYYDKNILKEKFETAKGRFDIYSLFLEKSLNILKKNGKIGFILPLTLLYNNNFTEIRKFIIDRYSIFKIINLGQKVFKDVDLDMIVFIIINNKYKDNIIKCKNLSEYNDKEENIYNIKSINIKQNNYFYNLNYIFDIDSDDFIYNFRKKFYYNGYIKVNDYCEVIAGIATGNIRNKLLTYQKNKFSKKVLEGKDIDRYYYKWKGLYINYDKSIINKDKGEYATFMRQEFIDSEKIIIRQTADRFICAYDNNRYHILNTLYSLIIRKEYKYNINIKYVLALLNSKLYNFLYMSLIKEYRRVFPQLKIYHIQQSPFKLIDLERQSEFVDLVDLIIKHRKSKEFNKVENLLRILDHLIYKLFDLNNTEIDLIEKEMKLKVDNTRHF